jgi:hypothetical protein
VKSADLERHAARVVAHLRRQAARWTCNGRLSTVTMARLATSTYDDGITETRILYTRDVGHHTSGWIKNPDYERCLHLSLSPSPPLVLLPRGVQLDRKAARLWVKAFFGQHVRYVWAESPKSPMGRERGVWHWRLFCDAAWQPILPRGEVYSTEFTELGWRTASQVLAEDGVPEPASNVDPS